MPRARTKDKKLRSGTPVWASYKRPKIRTETLTHDQKIDVVIVGAGISGVMIAEELTDAGFSVIILDRHKPMTGSTAATTALLLYEIDVPMVNLKKDIGLEKTIRVWRRSKLGLDNLTGKIRRLDIKCEAQKRSSLYLAGNVLDADGLKEEATLRNNIGLATEFLSAKSLEQKFGIKKKAALRSFDGLEVNPLLLAGGFVKTALSKGARLFSPVEVNNVDSGLFGVRVQTSDGMTIKAKHLVYATGYEMPDFVPSKNHRINSTWAFATKPQRKLWKDRDFIWESSDPYLYLRTTPDKRIICGGEDEEFSNANVREALTPEKIKKLQAKLQKLLPHVDTKADFVWSGDFGSGETGLPTIGEIPKMRNCYAVMGYGGNGITYSRIAAELIRARLMGIDDPDASLFEF